MRPPAGRPRCVVLGEPSVVPLVVLVVITFQGSQWRYRPW